MSSIVEVWVDEPFPWPGRPPICGAEVLFVSDGALWHAYCQQPPAHGGDCTVANPDGLTAPSPDRSRE